MISLNENQVSKIKHMLGLDYKKYAYRNYYNSGKEIDPDFDILIENEMMIKRNAGKEMGGYYYYLTDKGIDWFGKFWGKFTVRK